MICGDISKDRRRAFWATQVDACGVSQSCAGECGSPGLAFSSPGVISTDNWVRGLVLNMLMTDGRMPNTDCGYAPGAQGGHWSESYGAGDIGTLLRKIPTTGTVRESINLITGYAQATLERLIQRGVASAVDVQSRYLGNNVMALDVTITGTGSFANARVGLSANKTAQGWIWGIAN